MRKNKLSFTKNFINSNANFQQINVFNKYFLICIGFLFIKKKPSRKKYWIKISVGIYLINKHFFIFTNCADSKRIKYIPSRQIGVVRLFKQYKFFSLCKTFIRC